jgi:hypothetical protein
VNTTKEGIEVKQGQVWRDLDTRMGERYCKVTLVYDEVATMQRCRPNGATVTDHLTRVKVRRMHKHSTGWALVS